MAKRTSLLKKLPKKAKLALLAAIAIALVIAAAALPGLMNSSRHGQTVSEVSLKEAISMSKLSTAEFTYNGIAEKLDRNGNTAYHIYYEASAKAGVDMDLIDFAIDAESKTITVLLPPISVADPVIDESHLEYLPSNPDVQLREVLEICKADVQRELEANPNIRETAEANLRAILEALLMPVIGDDGYRLDWGALNAEEEGGTDEVSE